MHRKTHEQGGDYIWFKSSRSAGDGSCVNIAFAGQKILVRDSKDKAGPYLRFDRSKWQRFIGEVKDRW